MWFSRIRPLSFAGPLLLCAGANGPLYGGVPADVDGPVLLNEDLAPVTATLNLSIHRGIYVQETDRRRTEDRYAAEIVFSGDDSGGEARLGVTFRRVGKTPIFRTGLIIVISPDDPLDEEAARWNESIVTQTHPSLVGVASEGCISPPGGGLTISIAKDEDEAEDES